MVESTGWNLVFINITPIILLVSILFIWKYLLTLEGKRFPFKDILLRRPGESLIKKIEDLNSDLDLQLMLLIVIPSFLYTSYLQVKLSHPEKNPYISLILLLLIGSLVFVVLIIKLIKNLNNIRNYNLGFAGELAVGQALDKLMLNGYVVFHDIQVDNLFNIDHVLVGKNGVFAVETKTKRKPKTIKGKTGHNVTYDGNALTFDGDKTRNKTFLDQSLKNAKWLKNYLESSTGESVFVSPVLAIPGWFVTRSKNGKVRVLSHNEIKNIPNINTGKMLSDKQIQQINHQLEILCKNVDLAPEALK